MLSAAVLLAAVVAVQAAGQSRRGGVRTHTDAERGYRIKVPSFMVPIPVKDFDRQTIAKWTGDYDAGKGGHQKRQLSYWLVRIDTQESAPVTGTGRRGAPGAPQAQTLAEARERQVNEARTLRQFLERRDQSDRVSRDDKLLGRRGLESREGLAYQCWYGKSFRAYLTDDGDEIFGLLVFGYENEWDREVLYSVKSLTREGLRESVREEDDPYADDDPPLRDVERRRRVRANLIDGWEAHDTENFILVTNVRRTTTIKRMLADLEIMRVAYQQRFPPVTRDALEVVSTVRVCDGYDEYLKYAGSRLRGTGGYWSILDEELVLYNPERRVPRSSAWLTNVDPIAVLYHEAMHQYLHYSNGEVPPGPWFNEGYGEVFGGAKVNRTKGEIRRIETNDARIVWVRKARKDRSWPDLRELLAMDQRAFYSKDPLRNYAFAWAFCYFLEQEAEKPAGRRNTQWAALPQNYLIALRRHAAKAQRQLEERVKDPAALKGELLMRSPAIQKAAFETAFKDVDFAELEAAWVAAMKKW